MFSSRGTYQAIVEFDPAIREEPSYYLAGRLRETLAERVGDFDLDVDFVGETFVVTGKVTSSEQRAEIDRLLVELIPGVAVRNDTTLPKLAQPSEPDVVS